jgi:hypothetical protein
MNKKRIIRIAQLTLTAVATLTFTGYAQARNHHSSDKIIVVRPAELPELARVAGQAMMLHDTLDGTTLLYVEQNHGARLAIFDVTDPAHVKAEGSTVVDAPGSFDFSWRRCSTGAVSERSGRGDIRLAQSEDSDA